MRPPLQLPITYVPEYPHLGAGVKTVSKWVLSTCHLLLSVSVDLIFYNISASDVIVAMLVAMDIDKRYF